MNFFIDILQLYTINVFTHKIDKKTPIDEFNIGGQHHWVRFLFISVLITDWSKSELD